jgi:hypothetical protein
LLVYKSLKKFNETINGEAIIAPMNPAKNGLWTSRKNKNAIADTIQELINNFFI